MNAFPGMNLPKYLRNGVESIPDSKLTDVTAKVVIYVASWSFCVHGEVMHGTGKMLGSFQFAFYECFVPDSKTPEGRRLVLMSRIEIFNAHAVEFSLVSHPGISQQDHDVTE